MVGKHGRPRAHHRVCIGQLLGGQHRHAAGQWAAVLVHQGDGHGLALGREQVGQQELALSCRQAGRREGEKDGTVQK